MFEGDRMPGAMCGLWGICGAITSLGAALAIIDGPRCCKRDAMIAFKNAIDYVNTNYNVELTYSFS